MSKIYVRPAKGRVVRLLDNRRLDCENTPDFVPVPWSLYIQRRIDAGDLEARDGCSAETPAEAAKPAKTPAPAAAASDTK